MRQIKITFASVLVVLLAIAGAGGRGEEKPPVELNTILMECTFRLEGPGTNGQTQVGTAFVVGRPFPNEPTKASYVLVTAAHILHSIKGELAVVHLRRLQGPARWERLPFPLQIRVGERPLWTEHPQADVAVMYVRLPDGAIGQIVPTTMLADDKMLAQYGIHPGDALSCLGYPFGAEGSPSGFAILRSGKISSYPLLPTKDTKTFLFDFRIFGGNSGGPVYFVESNRVYGGTMHLGETIQFIIGLVSQEKVLKQMISEPYMKGEREYQLGLAEVVHASLIKEAVDLLPPPNQMPD